MGKIKGMNHSCIKCGAREELGDIRFSRYREVHHGIDGSWGVPIWKCKICNYEADWGYEEWPLIPELTIIELMQSTF